MIDYYKNIDRKDKNILNSLLRNCRKNYSGISKEIRLSKETIRYRIKRMEEGGILKYYKTLIDYSVLGLQVYEILLRLKKLVPKKEKEFIEFLEKSDVLGYGDLQGEFDYTIVVALNSAVELNEFKEKMKKILGDEIESIDILMNIKEDYIYDNEISESKKIEINETEKKLLKLLIHRANIPLNEISKKLNRSYPSIVKSLKNLEGAGVIKAYYPDIVFMSLDLREYLIFLKTRPMSPEQEKKFLDYVAEDNNTFWFVKYVGKYDWGIQFVCSGLKAMRQELDKFISKFEDIIIETKTVRVVAGKK